MNDDVTPPDKVQAAPQGAKPDAEHLVLQRSFCRNCGELLSSDDVCVTCGPQAEIPEDNRLAIRSSLPVLICEQCQTVMSLGVTACPKCGDVAEFQDPDKASKTRLKKARLGHFLAELQTLADVSQVAEASLDLELDQLINYVKRLDLAALIDPVKASFRQIDATSRNRICSLQTKKGFEALLSHARKARAVYDELMNLRATEQLHGIHVLIAAVYKVVIDLSLAGTEAILASTIESAGAAQRRMQVVLDQGAEAAEAIRAELTRIDPQEYASSPIDRRLSSFTGQAREYEYKKRPDFAAVLFDALQQHPNHAELGQEGAAYFRVLRLKVDTTYLSYGQNLSLYMLAAEVKVSDDPLTLLRRTSVYLAVLEDAYQSDPAAMIQALSSADPDIDAALAFLLSTADMLLSLSLETLSSSAAQLIMLQTYHILAEYIFQRLINLLLVAKSILDGAPVDYANIAAQSLGEKYGVLEQAANPRYVTALLGVAMIARNAGAHGQVEMFADGMRLTQSDREGNIRIEEISNEQYAQRLNDLFLTCMALRNSGALLRIEHYDTMPADPIPAQQRTRIEAARVIVGYFGLYHTIVKEEARKTITIEAVQDSRRSIQNPIDLLPAAVVAAAYIFADSDYVQLHVVQENGHTYKLTVPTNQALAYLALSEEVQLLGQIKLRYLSIQEPTAPATELYLHEVIEKVAILIGGELNNVSQLYTKLPLAFPKYKIAVETLLRKIGFARQMLGTIESAPQGGKAFNQLLSCLDVLERDLVTQIPYLVSNQSRIPALLPDPAQGVRPMFRALMQSLDEQS